MCNDTHFKTCGKCGSNLPATIEFWYKNKTKRDGLSTWCKECDKIKTAEYRKDNHDKALEATRNWRKNNPDHVKEYTQTYREDNVESIREQERNYWKQNPEKKRAKDTRYRKLHPEKVLMNAKRWRQEHPEEARKIQKTWDDKHPENIRAKARRRRVKKLEADGGHTIQDIYELYLMQNEKCYHCGCDISQYYEEDHWIPLDRGGSDWISNIRLLCMRCNRSKSNKLPGEWDGRYKI